MTDDIKKYEFKPGLPIEFEIVGLKGLYEKHKNLLTSPHRTGFYHVLWFQEGHPTHLVDFEPVSMEPNSVLFLNKDMVHSFDSHAIFDGIAILFTDSFFCKTDFDSKFLGNSILFNDLYAVSQIRLKNESSLFYRLVDLMKEELKIERDACQPEILQNLLHNFLLLSERERRKQDFIEVKKGADLDYVMLFKGLLEHHYRNWKQVGIYAKKLHVTGKRLNQATSKIWGKSPKQIIDERVMLEAKRLLAYTNESVKEIGFSLGFDEPTNFIKFFRKHSQLTPVEFRENHALA